MVPPGGRMGGPGAMVPRAQQDMGRREPFGGQDMNRQMGYDAGYGGRQRPMSVMQPLQQNDWQMESQAHRTQNRGSYMSNSGEVFGGRAEVHGKKRDIATESAILAELDAILAEDTFSSIKPAAPEKSEEPQQTQAPSITPPSQEPTSTVQSNENEAEQDAESRKKEEELFSVFDGLESFLTHHGKEEEKEAAGFPEIGENEKKTVSFVPREENFRASMSETQIKESLAALRPLSIHPHDIPEWVLKILRNQGKEVSFSEAEVQDVQDLMSELRRLKALVKTVVDATEQEPAHEQEIYEQKMSEFRKDGVENLVKELASLKRQQRRWTLINGKLTLDLEMATQRASQLQLEKNSLVEKVAQLRLGDLNPKVSQIGELRRLVRRRRQFRC